ncbi:MAG TPA: DUF1385 domain-containing protein [Fimbriimonadaceae bacterium]|nr:DUF1385 domain-containing protein [Fimbriimonadaceae bacterium]
MDALTQPVSSSMRPVRPLGIEASCNMAAAAVRVTGGGIVPLTRDDVFVGVITERGLRAALDQTAEPDDPIEPFAEQILVLSPHVTGAEALREFEASPSPGAVVVDEGGVVWGLLFPSDLFPKPTTRVRPAMIGGMAAPFGVHLTAGIASAGPGKWALVVTGAYLSAVLLISRILAYGAAQYGLHHGLKEAMAENLANGVTLLGFAILLRLSPLAGYHAAEHQVVHALERGENLDLKTVARMPRVHPRCGTNVATGVMMASIIFGTDFGLPKAVADFQPLIAIVVGLAFWRRAGAVVQYWITTRPANRRQLEAGIRSGQALLNRYVEARNLRPNPWKSLWNSGMVQVGLGFMLFGFAATFFFDAIDRLDVVKFGLGIL